jgi:hypothetical protein
VEGKVALFESAHSCVTQIANDGNLAIFFTSISLMGFLKWFSIEVCNARVTLLDNPNAYSFFEMPPKLCKNQLQCSEISSSHIYIHR